MSVICAERAHVHLRRELGSSHKHTFAHRYLFIYLLISLPAVKSCVCVYGVTINQIKSAICSVALSVKHFFIQCIVQRFWMLQIFIIFYHAYCFLLYIGLPIENHFLFTTGCIVNTIFKWQLLLWHWIYRCFLKSTKKLLMEFLSYCNH